MRKLLLATATAAVMAIAYPSASNATCTQTGTVTDVFEYHDGFLTTQFLFLRTGAIASHAYFFAMTDDSLTGFAAIAATSQAQVEVQGNAASCPTTGGERNGGTVNFIWIR